ncbi:MAG: ribonuclease HI [Bdellovibrionota bacterium]|nr:ribonuclease HI [Bdellovibrionota bacterium]
MKKATLKTKIKDLGKYLTSDAAQDALAVLERELKVCEEPKAEQNTAKDFLPPKELAGSVNALALFSDGGCRGNPGPGAYAYMLQNAKGEVLAEFSEVAAFTTNNKMELSGVIQGLKFAATEYGVGTKIFVYTDSKYVVDGIKSWVAGWKKRGWKKADKKEPENLDFWKELDQLNLKMDLEFHWVKGHAGHPQNERVDELANLAMDANGY